MDTLCLTDFYMEMSMGVSLLRTAQSLLTGRTIHKDNWPHTLVACFSTDQSFSYFCRRSPNDHFCKIILNSDNFNLFQRFLKLLYLQKATPRATMFFNRSKFIFAIFVVGHLVTISAKLFSILVIIFVKNHPGNILWSLVKIGLVE